MTHPMGCVGIGALCEDPARIMFVRTLVHALASIHTIFESTLPVQVVASYEYYTMEWIQRQVKEAAPQKLTSFSQMDSRPR